MVVCGRHEPAADQLPTAADASGGVRTAVFVTGDVREADQAAAVVESAVTRFGRIDTLVNNAGGSPSADAATASPRFSASIVSLNLLAPLYCAQAANSFMQEQEDGGSIVNITSVSGIRPSPGSSAYGAAKAGLINLTQTLAVEWAPKVRVNSVSAGLVATEAADEYYGGPEGMARVAATVPLGRFGTPEDVAGPCLFLASPLAGYVTGANSGGPRRRRVAGLPGRGGRPAPVDPRPGPFPGVQSRLRPGQITPAEGPKLLKWDPRMVDGP